MNTPDISIARDSTAVAQDTQAQLSLQARIQQFQKPAQKQSLQAQIQKFQTPAQQKKAAELQKNAPAMAQLKAARTGGR